MHADFPLDLGPGPGPGRPIEIKNLFFEGDLAMVYVCLEENF